MASNSGFDSNQQTPGWVTLKFTAPDPSQTQIVNEAGQVVYNVNTDEGGSRIVTVYSDAQDKAFATLEWHMANSDRLSFVNGLENSHGGRAINIDNWLKASWKWTKLRLIFESGGKKYKWKEMNATALLRPLQLYSMDDETKEPIAYYTPSATITSKKPSDTIPRTSTLRLSPLHFTSDSGQQFERDVVLSALLTEKL